jgi:hypothetical protein
MTMKKPDQFSHNKQGFGYGYRPCVVRNQRGPGFRTARADRMNGETSHLVHVFSPSAAKVAWHLLSHQTPK